ncbi:MAG: aldose 1-epimerase family protein [Limisphaerales bacterium]
MRNLLCLALMTSSVFTTSAAELLRQVLTSATRDVHLDAWQINSRDLDPQSPVPWSVEKHTLHGGKQEGVDVIVVDNGRLRITVIPTRGMGIVRVEAGGMRLGWDSPVKEIVHPQFINLQSRGGLGWLEGFNEWLVRCGLEFAGHPGKDKFINNVGDEAEMDLTLHGKIANIPASEVEVIIDRDPPHRLRIRGQVNERMFYGPKLELWTELSTEPGANSFRIEDTVTNHGAYDQEMQIIYHTNFGPPLLQDGARFVAAANRIVPFNARAAEGLEHYTEYAGPTKGFIEQVYCLYPYADDHGQTMVMLENAAADRAVSLRFSTDQLPYFTLWKNTTAFDEGYVTGLEPGTGFPYNRRIERKFGRVPKLKPGESRQFTLDFTLHSDKDAVARAAKEIAQIQGDRKTQVDTEPPKVE